MVYTSGWRERGDDARRKECKVIDQLLVLPYDGEQTADSAALVHPQLLVQSLLEKPTQPCARLAPH
jgi:hypothetical protein